MAQTQVKDAYSIAVIGGDGIGPEVVAEGLKVLEAVTGDGGPTFTTTDYDLGARRWHATGETLPDTFSTSCAATTRSSSAPSATRASRAACSSGESCCPCASPSTTTSTCARPSSSPAWRARSTSPGRPRGIDFVVVREGTEGPYTGNGGALRVGTPAEIATEVSVNTRYGVERVVRDAFARAQAGRAST